MGRFAPRVRLQDGANDVQILRFATCLRVRFYYKSLRCSHAKRETELDKGYSKENERIVYSTPTTHPVALSEAMAQTKATQCTTRTWFI